MNTPPGKRYIANYASSVLSRGPLMNIQIAGLTGVVPTSLRADRIELSDDDGVFLTVSGAAVRWSLLSVFKSRIEIAEISAETVDLTRRPPRNPNSDPIKTIQSIPNALRGVSVDKLVIDKLIVGDAVAGEAATFEVNGHLVSRKLGELSAGLTVDRTDKPTTSAEIGIELGGNTSGPKLSMLIQDSTFLPHGLSLPEDDPFVIRLEGTGDTHSWKGNLRGTLGDQPFLDSAVALADDGEVTLDCDGTFQSGTFPQLKALKSRLGDHLAFHINTSLDTDGSLSLAALRIVTDPVTWDARARYDKPADTLTASASVETQSLAKLLSVTQAGLDQPATLGITLNGSLGTPAATATVSLSGDDVLNATGEFDLRDGYRFRIDATGKANLLLVPQGLAEALGAGIALHVDGTYGAGGALDLHRGMLRAMGGELRATGSMDTGSKDLEAKIELDDFDVARLGTLVPEGIRGAISLRGDVHGSANGLTVVADIAAKETAAGPMRAKAITLTLKGRGDTWPLQALDGVTLSGDAAFTNVMLGSVNQPKCRLAWECVFPDGTHVQLRQLGFASDDIQADSSGEWDIDTRAGTFTLKGAVKNLGILRPGLEGSGTVDATILTNAETPLDARFNATIRELSGLPDIANALAAPETALSGSLVLTPQRSLIANDMRVKNERIAAQGRVSYTLSDQATNVDVDFSVPDVAVLSPAIGKPISGAAEGSIRADGPIGNLAAQLQLQSDRLTVNATGLRNASFNADFKGIPGKTEGPIHLGFAKDSVALTADSSLQFSDSVLALSSLKVSAGPNTVSGAVRVDLNDKSVEGHIEGVVPELAIVGDVIGADIAGHADLSVDVSGPYGLPAARGFVVLEDFKSGHVDLKNLRVDAEGDAGRTRVSVNASGGTAYDTPFDGKAVMEVTASEKRVLIKTLDATLAEHKIRLANPASLQRDADCTTIDLAALSIDDGTVGLTGTIDATSVGLTGSLSDVPLGLLQMAGLPKLEGSASGTLEMNCLSSNPAANASLSIQGLREEGAGYDPIALNATAKLQSGNCVIDSTLTSSDKLEVKARAGVPVRLAMNAFSANIPKAGIVSAQLDATADLAVLALLADLPDHDFRGDLDAHFSVGGTVASPEVAGEARVENGRYENLRTGTILDELEAVLRADGRELHMAEFHATDGNNGRVTATGHLDFDPQQDFPFELRTYLTNARLANRDDLNGQANGDVSLTGNTAGIQVDGTLTIGPATATISERLPAKYAQLDVNEINTPEAANVSEETGAQTSRKAPIPVELNFVCDLPGKVYVMSRQTLDSEWKGRLTVKGTAQAPAVTGTLTPVRGQVMFLDRAFALRESSITLDGQTPPTPYLDLNAEAKTKELTAALHLFGLYPTLRLELSSEPSLPQDEILARLLFGRSMKDVSPLQAIRLATMAESMHGSNGLGVLTGSSRTLAGVRVQMHSEGAGLEGASVSAGKYLNNRVYVEVEKGISDQTGSGKIGVEATPEISVEGKVGSEGSAGIGFSYRHDY